jgi:hypothetical protein
MPSEQPASGAQVPCISLLAEPFKFPPLPEPRRIIGIEIKENALLPSNAGMMTDGKHTVVFTANDGLQRPKTR